MSRQLAKRRRKPGRALVPRNQFPSLAQQELFLERFEECLNPLTARKCANISKKHYEELIETDPIFLAAMRKIIAAVPDRCELRLMEAGAVEGNIDANKTIVAAYKPERYGSKTKLELTVRDVTKMTDDELEEQYQRAVEQLR